MPGRQILWLLAAALGLALWCYGPALHGVPISDDLATLEAPEIQSLGWANLRAIFDPNGPVVPVFVNYAPLHALFHAFEIALFGHDLLAFHLVNVVLHAIVAVQLALLFVRTGIPRHAAWLGALFFLVHPANVEAVAWISQLKTTSSTALALGALLAHRRHPLVATLLFGAALLAKAQAAFALPVLAWLELVRDPGIARAQARARWGWVAAWGAAFAAFYAIEAPVLIGFGTTERAEFAADRALHVRTMLAIAGRYLAMAATGFGVSTLHEPPLARALADPWSIAGALALLSLGARAIHAVARRRIEAAYWIWAAAAYAPVSQALPFMYLMSDRYLYTVLPGLIGGALLACGGLAQRIGDAAWRRRIARGAGVAALVVSIAFAVQVRTQRAPVWKSTESYEIDAALRYPDGVTGHVLRARGHARRGDADAAVASLRAARARGWTWIGALWADPAFAAIRGTQVFRSFAFEVTQQSVDALRARPTLTIQDLEILAQLHLWRGERAEAIAALERAVATGSPAAAGARRALATLRAGEGR